ncbi:hypothetical protein JTE90_021029 [Oedothorax gibbosus]|uniref:Lipase domain-containing protein n=1 Tax=Oedothorax gibbosus TaxID=931172 RepID=A0AAV6U792_9ARAC|nr:hypothetical protein JTE90_021029 [Oedothorax gibbosus]
MLNLSIFLFKRSRNQNKSVRTCRKSFQAQWYTAEPKLLMLKFVRKCVIECVWAVLSDKVLLFNLFLGIHFMLKEGVQSSCYPDEKQICDMKSAGLSGTWNTTMRFLLFTRRNHKFPEMLHMCHGRLPKYSNFNPKNRLIVFIPGYLFGPCELADIPEIKDELLAKEDVNVILIEDRYEIGINFFAAKERQSKIAQVIVNVLQNIQDMTGLRNDDVYLVGHSLGAHIAGSVGSKFKVHRITALDPAGVVYNEKTPIEHRLDSTDADIVDVLHCNGGNRLPYLSITFPSGDADFYINGGSDQPNCLHNAWEAIKHFQILYAIGTTAVPYICSHALCLTFYKLSINNKQGNFTSWNCDSYDDFKSGKCHATPVTMGYNFEKHARKELKARSFPKTYYVDTSDSWPYVTNNGTYRRTP